MNKNTKIWLNYLIGGAISVFLIWNIWQQVTAHLKGVDPTAWEHTGPVVYVCVCIALMFLNTSLEGYKWHTLINTVEPSGFRASFSSYLAGVAFSLITPNRVGEYPGRILYLGKPGSIRYVPISILGVLSQLMAVYLFGLISLIYYSTLWPAPIVTLAITACLIVNIGFGLIFWKFKGSMALVEKIPWLRRVAIYARLLDKISLLLQLKILTISVLRFCIFTAQYLFLLRWMRVEMPLWEGFWIISLFFWIMSVIPSLALTELGIKGTVSLYLLNHYSSNDVGILAATVGIWLLNLIVPAATGSVLLMKMKYLRYASRVD